MERVEITLALGTMPDIGPGSVRELASPDLGIRLLMEPRAVTPGWMGLLKRVYADPTLQGGEVSFSQQVGRVGRGDRSHVALPVFAMREFAGRDLYVRKGSSIRNGSDLNGKRIGMYAFRATGTLWYRNFLEYIGTDLNTVKWVVGGVDEPGASKFGEVLPPEVGQAPDDRGLAQMLVDGEIDALLCYPPSKQFHVVNGPIVHMFSDIKGVEQQFYNDTGVFPIQHVVALRADVVKAYPWIARSITEAFKASEEAYRAMLPLYGGGGFWSRFDIAETGEVMGPGFRFHGIEGNEAALEAFFRSAHRAGVTERKLTTEEVFAEYLASGQR